MNVKDLLSERGLKAALIVDDAYDDVPLPEDIEGNADGWANFFDDLGEDSKTVVKAFPAYSSMSPDELMKSRDFIAAIYSLKKEIRREVWQHLFDGYERDQVADRGVLDTLNGLLNSFGLEVSTAGRITEVAAVPDIIFVDLFLGAAQSDRDIQKSIERIRGYLKDRQARPPLVFLMSRSASLMEKKSMFRDSANLLGTMFRVYKKHDLISGDALERALVRLATHYDDALNLATFMCSWEMGMNAAVARAVTALRRLDITDYAQIREVLLNYEGQLLGSYVLDVFDRVLQHEIEADENTMNAAEQLSKIKPRQYLAPYIAGSPDLQELVAKTIWQHKRRLGVTSNECGAPVGFGDVLVCENRTTGVQDAKRGAQQATAADIDASIAEKACADAESVSADVLVVLTPACDLARDNGVKRVLLLAGEIAELTPNAWKYGAETLKTPIVVLNDGKRYWIKWKAKDLSMLRTSELSTLIESKRYGVVGRLRESNAIELQQSILAVMGRVGLIAQMPATFPVKVEVWSLNREDKLFKHDLPILVRDGGVCYVGRDERANENILLVLTEEAIDEIAAAIGALREEQVHVKSWPILQKLIHNSNFFQKLDMGLRISSKEGNASLQAEIQDEEGAVKNIDVAIIARINTEDEMPATKNKQNAGFMLVLREADMPTQFHASDVTPVAEGGVAKVD